MGDPTSAHDRHKIIVLNPKGGCGKTTLATNVASYFAVRGQAPTILDCDRQGFSLRWLEKRPTERPPIHGMPAYELALSSAVTRVGDESRVIIADLPAAIPYELLHDYTHLADSVLIPITPSEIDVYSASRFIAELLLDVKVDRREMKVAIVANRVRSRTKSYEMLLRYLTSLKIPMIATLRDTQNFVRSAASGIGVCEMAPSAVKADVAQINAIGAWLEGWETRRRENTGAISNAPVVTPFQFWTPWWLR